MRTTISAPAEEPRHAFVRVAADARAAGPLLVGWPGLLFTLCVGGWFGAMLFFSGVATPQVFGVLGTQQGGPVVAAMFPRYYAAGAVCSLVGAIVLAAAWRGTRRRRDFASAVGLTVGALILIGSWLILEPMVADAKGGFRGTLHMLSVALNGVDLLLTAFALAVASLRR